MELRTPSSPGATAASPPDAAGRRRFAPPRFLRGSPPSRGRVNWPFVGLCVVGLGLFLASALLGENGLATQRRLARERTEMTAEVERLRAQRRELQTRIAALRADPAALERLAREKYGMKRAGEDVLEFVGDEHLTDGRTASVTAPANDPRNPAPPPATRLRPNLLPAYPAPAPTEESAAPKPAREAAPANSRSKPGTPPRPAATRR